MIRKGRSDEGILKVISGVLFFFLNHYCPIKFFLITRFFASLRYAQNDSLLRFKKVWIGGVGWGEALTNPSNS